MFDAIHLPLSVVLGAFHFYSVSKTFEFPLLISYLTGELFRNVYLIYKYLNLFPDTFLVLISNLTPL